MLFNRIEKSSQKEQFVDFIFESLLIIRKQAFKSYLPKELIFVSVSEVRARTNLDRVVIWNLIRYLQRKGFIFIKYYKKQKQRYAKFAYLPEKMPVIAKLVNMLMNKSEVIQKRRALWEQQKKEVNKETPEKTIKNILKEYRKNYSGRFQRKKTNR